VDKGHCIINCDNVKEANEEHWEIDKPKDHLPKERLWKILILILKEKKIKHHSQLPASVCLLHFSLERQEAPQSDGDDTGKQKQREINDVLQKINKVTERNSVQNFNLSVSFLESL
jgi:adenine-specific DNA glycosylase